jgi:HPt (histidine-containing phosphotransfer) domain-containing protein
VQEPVDTSSLLMLRQLQQPGKPDAVSRIIVRFLEETEQRLEQMRRAVDRADAVALERAAHALLGIAGTVGATELLGLAVRLEQIGRQGRIDGAADLVAELTSAFGRARPIFEGLREPAAPK